MAHANVLAVTDATAEGAFNIASGAPHTVGEMPEALADAYGDEAPRPEIVGGFRAGDVRHIVALPEKAARILDFRARIPFEHGMREFSTAELREAAVHPSAKDGRDS